MISAYTIEAIKQAANVVEVVGDYVKLKKSGTDYEACCPFHNEKSPSFKVHPVKGIYKCFGCGTSGDAIEFVMKHQNKTYPEALEILAKRYNIPIEEDKPQPKRTYKRPQQPKFDLSPLALTYFISRKISGQILADFKVCTKLEWMPKSKAEVEAICFNYFRDGELINVKYRAKDKDFKLEKDAELIFYNLDSLKGAKYAVIVEGEIDALSVAQSGFKNGIVSVPNGANVTGAMKLEYLDNCYKEFEHIKQIVIFTDNDEAGRRLRDELGRRLGYDRCYMVTDYKGCKDANEILVKHDADAVLNAITSATEFPIEGIVNVDDIYKDVHSFYVNGYPNGFKCGIPNFDNLLQFMLGQFTVITGTPGAGKSEFTDYIITELARVHEWRFAVCSFENQPSSLHVTKLMEKCIGKSFSKRYDENDRISPNEFEESINFVADRFNFININTIEVTLDGILEKCAELVLRRGIKGVLIDPWNYIEYKAQNGQSETKYVSDALTKIKAFCIRYNVHLFLIAHPTKMPKVNGKYEVPNLYSISGSAHFYNKADNGIVVYRDTETVQIYVQKVRYSWLGKIGMAEFKYNIDRRKYEAIGEPDPFMKQIPDNPHAGINKKISDIPF
jgi:twinkle protein